MRVISTLIVSALALLLVVPTMVSAASEPYPGIVITSIDAKLIDDTKKVVEFSGDTSADRSDKTALILKNVVEVRKGGIWGFRYPIFQGEIVSKSELKASVKKPLLVIHGFRVQPQTILKNCKKNRDKFKKFDLIPVIWPTTTGNYWADRDFSKAAGEALWTSMREFAGMFPRKSIMAHSMGNRVLRHAADGVFKFDNIFMVGADVQRQIFSKDYINHKDNDGLGISKMLNDAKSKIYCLHNVQDIALTTSNIIKLGVPRLGARGADMDNLHPDLVGKVENVNCGKKWLNGVSNFAAHNYHWDDQAVQIYESKFIE